ncbi:MAG TPA: hypothetical protein VGS57_07625 [Thermoanaerobaculia bacterium]|jgi:hypothetical protein|nr:hypothetical protein [Thermoanaerobaculia bacterium]
MSNAISKSPAPLLDLERDLPTTATDVAALRRLRGTLPPGLEDVASQFPLDLVTLLAKRPTSEGWEPFTL